MPVTIVSKADRSPDASVSADRSVTSRPRRRSQSHARSDPPSTKPIRTPSGSAARSARTDTVAGVVATLRPVWGWPISRTRAAEASAPSVRSTTVCRPSASPGPGERVKPAAAVAPGRSSVTRPSPATVQPAGTCATTAVEPDPVVARTATERASGRGAARLRTAPSGSAVSETGGTTAGSSSAATDTAAAVPSSVSVTRPSGRRSPPSGSNRGR
jgi:hypothetical protein